MSEAEADSRLMDPEPEQRYFKLEPLKKKEVKFKEPEVVNKKERSK